MVDADWVGRLTVEEQGDSVPFGSDCTR